MKKSNPHWRELAALGGSLTLFDHSPSVATLSAYPFKNHFMPYDPIATSAGVAAMSRVVRDVVELLNKANGQLPARHSPVNYTRGGNT